MSKQSNQPKRSNPESLKMVNVDKEYNPKKNNPNGRTKLYLAVLLAGAVLVAGGIYQRKHVTNSEHMADKNNTQKTEQVAGTQTSAVGNYLEGILQSSDDQAKGNLKVVSNSSTVYLRTSRNFSELLGANVMVTIEGTLDNFKLLDIKKNIEQNGYILPK